MTLQERLEVYTKQHSELAVTFEEVKGNLHRLGGAIASVTDQIKEAAEEAAKHLAEDAHTIAEVPELIEDTSDGKMN